MVGIPKIPKIPNFDSQNSQNAKTLMYQSFPLGIRLGIVWEWEWSWEFSKFPKFPRSFPVYSQSFILYKINNSVNK